MSDKSGPSLSFFNIEDVDKKDGNINEKIDTFITTLVKEKKDKFFLFKGISNQQEDVFNTNFGEKFSTLDPMIKNKLLFSIFYYGILCLLPLQYLNETEDKLSEPFLVNDDITKFAEIDKLKINIERFGGLENLFTFDTANQPGNNPSGSFINSVIFKRISNSLIYYIDWLLLENDLVTLDTNYNCNFEIIKAICSHLFESNFENSVLFLKKKMTYFVFDVLDNITNQSQNQM